MEKEYYIYTVFLTSWGWTGFAASQKGLEALVLPEKTKEDAVFRLKKSLGDNNIIGNNKGWENLIEKIREYFKGKKIDFSDYRLNLDNYTVFQKKIYQTVKKIPYGETRSYREIAEISGYPKAYRAVGTTMKNNLIPLIIPCHRIIKSDGDLGGFSGGEGVALKKKMIDLESNGKKEDV